MLRGPPLLTTEARTADERAVVAGSRWLRGLVLLSAAFFTLLDAVKQDAYNSALLDYLLPEPTRRTPKQIASILVVNDVSLTAVQMLVIGLFEQHVQPSIWCSINYLVSLVAWSYFATPQLPLVGLSFLFLLRSANVRYSMVVHWFGPLYYKYTMSIQFAVSVLPYIVKLPLFHFARVVVFERQQEMTVAAAVVYFLLVCALFRRLGVARTTTEEEEEEEEQPRTTHPSALTRRPLDHDDGCGAVLVSPTVTRLRDEERASRPTPPSTAADRLMANSDSILPFTSRARAVYGDEDAARLARDRDLLAFIRSREKTAMRGGPSPSPTGSTVASSTSPSREERSDEETATTAADKTGSWTCNLACCIFLAAVYYDFRMFDTYANQRLRYDFTYDMVYVHVGLFTVVFASNVAYQLARACYRRSLRRRELGERTIARLLNRARFLAVVISFVGVLASRVLFLALQLTDVASTPLLLLCVCMGGLGGNVQPLLAEMMFRQRTHRCRRADNGETTDSGEGFLGGCRAIWKRHSDQLFKWIYVDGRNLVNILLLLLWFVVGPVAGSWWFSANTIALLCLSFGLFLGYYFRHGRHVDR